MSLERGLDLEARRPPTTSQPPAGQVQAPGATVSLDRMASPQAVAIEVDLGLVEPNPARAGSPPAPPVIQGTGEGNRYLDVPFAEKDQAKALGARWDPEVKRWFVMPGRDLAPFEKWAQPHKDSEIHALSELARAVDSYKTQFYNGLEELWNRVRIATDSLGDASEELRSDFPKQAERIRHYYAKKFSDFSYSLEYPYFQEAVNGYRSSGHKTMKEVSKLGLEGSRQALSDQLDLRRAYMTDKLWKEHAKALKSLEGYIEKEPALRGRLAPVVAQFRAIQELIPVAVRHAVQTSSLWKLTHQA